ncbi:MAG TPA: PKD domain-containing protein [Thermoanaerobaculia bacterium]|jgi:hypothetical protein
MKRALFYAVLCIAAVTSAFATTRIVPVAGHVPGANNTAWTTNVSLRNNSGAAMTVELVFHANGVTRTRSVNLGAGASLLLEDAVDPAKFPGANPSSWLGQLEIRAPGDVSVSAHTFTQGKHGGTFGSTYEGVDPAVLSTSGVIAGLANSESFRSNVAFTNPADATITVTYALRRADGSVAANRTFDLAAHTTTQLSLGDDVATSSERLALFWSATGRAYAVASIVDNHSGDPTSAVSVSRDATSLFFPVVGRTAGGNSTFWSTSASVTATAGAGSVTFAYSDSASGQTFTRTALLPALGSVSTDDVNAFVGAPAGTGSLQVSSTTPLAAVVRVFNTLGDGSTFGSAVLPQHDVVRSTSVIIDGVRRDDDYRLNVAVANDDHGRTAEGEIRLFDDRGVEVERHHFVAEPGKSMQIGLSGNAAVRAGELHIETEHGVPVTAIASNIDNVTGDTVQRESEQENERQNELEIAMSTRTAPVSVPITFSLKHAGSDVTAVRWQFGDGTSASGATVTHSYIAAGEFDVTVEVTLAGGAVVRDREDVRITGSSATAPQPSAIDFTFTPANPAPGEQVVFTATGATSGGVFQWKFPGNIRPVGSTVTFAFPNAGSFAVEVEIEHGGTRAEVTRIVTVGGTPTGNAGLGPIDFTFSPAAPQAGQPVTFTASGNTGGGVFKWKFPGDVRVLGNTATFTFPSNGSFEVELEVEHGSVVGEITKIVTVGGGSSTTPTTPGTGSLNFTFSPQSPAPGQAVTFTATGNTGGGVFKWKFPGDVRMLGSVVTFTFAAAGSYEVEVEIEHGTVEGEIAKIVTVGGGSTGTPGTGTPLNFTFSPSSPTAGQAVTFTASGDTGGGTYKWKFPGDVRKTGSVVTFTFAAAGSYEVELEVEHGTVTSEVTKIVTVSGGGSNSNPGTPSTTLSFTFSPSAPRAGQAVTFTASGDTGGGTYRWKFPGDVRVSGPTATFTFSAAGSYEVELEVEHGNGAEVRRIVTVSP